MLSRLYSLARPALFTIAPETAHGLTLSALKSGLLPKCRAVSDPALEVTLWDRRFPNPVGLAAGFDKNAEAIGPLFSLGFGHVEAGTVTPRAQEGNPKPRIFRCPSAEAVINRMGFPNVGATVFKANLERALGQKPRPNGVIGINIGMNKNQKDPEKDYCALIRALGPMADYLAVNVSSPNTPGLRRLQGRERLMPLLQAIFEERRKSCGTMPPPLLVKLAPDLDEEQQHDIASVVLEAGVDGLILTNTSLDRPEGLPDRFASQAGGLSGAPIRDMSLRVLRNIYAMTSGKIPMIGVGGISTGEDAYARIRAGASLVQLYTSFVYRGPFTARLICEELLTCLKRDGFSNVREAIGADHR